MKKRWQEINPLSLAYLGDAVYELWIRDHLLNSGELNVNEMHKRATEYVKAPTQARIVQDLMPELTEEEQTVVKKGRNSKSGHPRNVDVVTYRYATGFEALIGYWYMEGHKDRLEWAMQKIFDAMESEQGPEETN